MKQLFFLLLFITVYICTAISQEEETDLCKTFNPGEIVQQTEAVCIDTDPSEMNVNEATGGSGNYSYQWYKDDVKIENATGTSYIPLTDTSTDGTYTYVCEVTDKDCESEKSDTIGKFKLIVHKSLNSGAISTGEKSVCLDEEISITNRTAASGGNESTITYRWISHRLTGKNDTIPTGAEATCTFTADTAGVFTYTREAQDGVCYKGNKWMESGNEYTLTVYDNLKAGSIPIDLQAGKTVCQHAEFTIKSEVDASGGDTSNIIYRWVVRNTNDEIIKDTVTGKNPTYMPSTDISGVFIYYRYAQDGTCVKDEKWVNSGNTCKLTIEEGFTPGSIQSGDTIVCFNREFNIFEETEAINTQEGGSITYRWKKRKDGESETRVITEATEAICTFQTDTAGTFIYTRETQNGKCAANEDWMRSGNEYILTVRHAFTPGSIQSGDTAVCNSSPGLTILNNTPASGGDSTNITYRWKVQHNDGEPQVIPNTNITSYTPSTTEAGTFTYTREARDITCEDWTPAEGTFRLTVRQKLQPGAILSGDTTLCPGSEFTVSNISEASGGYGEGVMYRWEVRKDNGEANEIANANSLSYAFMAEDAGTFIFTRYVQDSVCVQDREKEWIPSNPYQVTVLPPFTPGAIENRDTTVCIGSLFHISAGTEAAGGIGTYDYLWIIMYEDGKSKPLTAPSSIPSYRFSADSAGVFTCIRQSQDKFCQKSWTSLPDNRYTVTVRDSLRPGSIPPEAVACLGDTVNIDGTDPATGGEEERISYRWLKNTLTGNETGMLIDSSAKRASYVPETKFPGTYIYTRETQDGVCVREPDWISSNEYKLTVRDTLNPGAIQERTDTVCVGSTISISGGTATKNDDYENIIYQWIRQKDGGKPDTIRNEQDASYAFEATVPGTFTYTRRAKDQTCEEAWKPSGGLYTLIVRDSLRAGAISAGDTTVCPNAEISINGITDAFGGNEESIVYRWRTVAEDGSEFFSDETDKNDPQKSSYAPVTANPGIYTYFRQAKDGICASDKWLSSNPYRVIVRDTLNPGAIREKTDTVCVGSEIYIAGTADAFGGNEKNIIYHWTSSVETDTVIGKITGKDARFWARTPGTFTYTRRVKDQSCVNEWISSSNSYTLVVRDSLKAGLISEGGGEPVCFGAPIDIAGIKSASGGNEDGGSIRYRWIRREEGKSDIVIENAGNYDYNFDANCSGIFTYIREVQDGICAAGETWIQSNPYKVTVRDSLKAGSIQGGAETVCFGDTVGIRGGTNATGGDRDIKYRWKMRAENDAQAAVISNKNAGLSYIFPADTAGTFYFTREAQDGTCENERWKPSDNEYKLTVREKFTPGSIRVRTDTVCFGAEVNIDGTANAAGGDTEGIHYRWKVQAAGAAAETIADTDTTARTFSANTAGTFIFTREAQDQICVKDEQWMASNPDTLTVLPEFDSGRILEANGYFMCPDDYAFFTIKSERDAAGGYGKIRYRWRLDDKIIDGADSATYTLPPGISGTLIYFREARDEKCSDWKLSDNIFPLLARADFSAGSISTTGATVCPNDTSASITIESRTAATGGDEEKIVYRWRRNGEEIPGAEAAAYTPPTGIPGTFIYTREAKDGVCSDWKESEGKWKLTVYDFFDAGAIDSTGQTVCLNSRTNPIGDLLPPHGGDGVFACRWKKDGEIIPVNANDRTYMPTANTVGTFVYTREVKDGACSEWTKSGGSWTLTVLPAFSPGEIASTSPINTVLITDSFSEIKSISEAAGGDGRISYRWKQNGEVIPGATQETYTPAPDSTRSFSYTREAKDETCSSNGDWEQSAGAWILRVLSELGPGAIKTDGQVICLNSPAQAIENLFAPAGGNGNFSYRWKKNGTVISSPDAAGISYTPVPDADGTFIYTREVREDGSNEWKPSAGEWKLRVNPVPEITFSGIPDRVCPHKETVFEVMTSPDVTCKWNISEGKGSVNPVSDNSAAITWNLEDRERIEMLSVTLTDRNTGCRNTQNASVIVLPYTVPQVNDIVAKTDMAGTPYILIYPNPEKNMAFQWYYNNEPLENETEQFYYPENGILKQGNYQVYIFDRQWESCGNFTDPYAIDKLKSASDEWFSIHPNPSDGRFSITFNPDIAGKGTIATIRLFSPSGVKIREKRVSCDDRVDMNENLENGVYLLTVVTDRKPAETKQIIVKK